MCEIADMTRRDFLKEGAAFAAMGGRRGFLKCALAAGAFPHLAFAAPEGGADLRIGILADLHLHDDAGTTRKLERALRFFREARVDGVLVCGDIAHNGLVPQLEELAAAWQMVFPGDCGLDGMHVEKLFHYGDHDTGGKCHFRGDGTAEKLMEHYGCTRAGLDGMAIAPRRRETWERLFGEPWAPVMHKRVKGYDFVLSQYTAEGHNSAFGLGDFLKGFNPDPRKPFFYSQHRVLRNTACGSGAWGQDNGSAKAMLSRHPNCCAFFGHAHQSAIREDAIWQGAFTAVQVPSLSCVTQEPGHANKPNGWMAEQGMVLSVYGDRMVIQRIDFANRKPLGPAWELPPSSGGMPFAHETRRRAAVRPEFPAGATLSAKMEERGKDGDLHRSLTLEFPIVNGIGGGVRAYDYEVAVDAICFGGNAQRGVKRYFSPKCHFAPSADTGTMTVTYGLDEFKAWNSLKSRNWGALHVAVRPRETFGGVGRALEADVKAAERIGT